MKRNVIILMIALAMAVMLGACGSSGDDPPPNYNAILSGEYQGKQFVHDKNTDTVSVRSWDLLFDGNGTYEVLGPGGVTFSYSVAADRTVVAAGVAGGIISADGTILIMTQADPGDTEESLVIAVKKSTGTSASTFAGEYELNQVGYTTASGLYTSKVDIYPAAPTPAPDKRGFTIKEHSADPSLVGLTGTVTLTLNPSNDGTFSVDNGSGILDFGIVSADGSMFVIADTDISDGDNEIVLAVGIEKSTVTPDFSGTYQGNYMGIDGSAIFSGRANVTPSSGAFDITILLDSRGIPAGTEQSFPYSVLNTDGTFTLDSADNGIVSPDGRMVAIVDTSLDAGATPPDNELNFVIGIR